MKLQPITIFLFLATLLSSSHADFTADNPIKLRQRRSAPIRDDSKINCLSFRLGVEANNLRDWSTIPSHCKSYIKSYLTGKQYGLDIEAVAAAAMDHADTFEGPKNKLAWVFDVEETLLSNINYLNSSLVQYGTIPIDTESYYEWLKNNSATANTGIEELYHYVYGYEFNIFIVSEAPESMREDLINLLEDAGFYLWTELILKGDADNGKNTLQFKSEKRGEILRQGYTIVGNVGDQWSDLTGENAGTRTFKIPNPVYYIA